MNTYYDYRNCQSLFGYAQNVHKRSGGICQLCDAGKEQDVDFDLWRQLTVEHLIGESQGGYKKQIRVTINRRFPQLSNEQLENIAVCIDEANTVTACNFCNSTTSRRRNPISMDQLIEGAKGAPDEALSKVVQKLHQILGQKRADVQWKLVSIKEAFERNIKPELVEVRKKIGI